MKLKITAQVHREGKWFVAFCPEFPEANGQGETVEDCVQSLRDAIDLLLEDRREDAIRAMSKDTQVLELA
jgi:predicted RNase H-like HicB family nuclease